MVMAAQVTSHFYQLDYVKKVHPPNYFHLTATLIKLANLFDGSSQLSLPSLRVGETGEYTLWQFVEVDEGGTWATGLVAGSGWSNQPKNKLWKVDKRTNQMA